MEYHEDLNSVTSEESFEMEMDNVIDPFEQEEEKDDLQLACRPQLRGIRPYQFEPIGQVPEPDAEVHAPSVHQLPVSQILDKIVYKIRIGNIKFLILRHHINHFICESFKLIIL